MKMNNEWVHSVSQFAVNQNSTSSIQILLLVNRFMLKGRNLLPLETLPVFRGNTPLQKHNVTSLKERLTCTICSPLSLP
jgi:hypothetical protein